MVVIKNGEKWTSGKWQKIKYDVVKSPKHQLWEELQNDIKAGNRESDDNLMSYFIINHAKITLNMLYCRFGLLMGFDLKCQEYPKEINSYTDYFSVFKPVYCELDEYGERLRIWTKK